MAPPLPITIPFRVQKTFIKGARRNLGHDGRPVQTLAYLVGSVSDDGVQTATALVYPSQYGAWNLVRDNGKKNVHLWRRLSPSTRRMIVKKNFPLNISGIMSIVRRGFMDRMESLSGMSCLGSFHAIDVPAVILGGNIFIGRKASQP